MNVNIQITLTIYQHGFDVVLAAFDGIADEHFNWKPAPDSRSIAEICRHLIRVDVWYLQQMAFAPAARDSQSNSLPEIQAAFESGHQQIRQIIEGLKDDDELLQIRKSPEAKREFSLEYAVKHIAQHYLYHTAQIIYLRRAQDRAWPAPLEKWESAVDAISKLTWQK
jgi:uncharacterized damage-inducible protein DinB